MFRKLADLAGRRPRILVLGAALALGAGGLVPIVVAAPPALALNCSFDAFYYFQSDSTTDLTGISSPDYLADDGGLMPAASFCQLDTGYGAGWYEWVQQGTSNCLTLYAANLVNGIPQTHYIYVTPCASHPSQEWFLAQNLGGEDWGAVKNGWDSIHGWYLADPGYQEVLSYSSPYYGARLNITNHWTLIYAGK